MEQIRVLFVCMGNICRSPTAEGVFRKLVEDEGVADFFHIDSAGTHAYHVNNPPDHRAQKAALARGIDISPLRARQVAVGDFSWFHHILVMDQENYDALRFMCPKPHTYKLQFFLDYAPALQTREVPDPYYGGPQGFERVLDMIEQASRGFLERVKREGFASS
jgi:protein-tyrosine phosphatase